MWLGEIGTPPEFLSGPLNYAPVTMTAKAYNRASNIEPKRKAIASQRKTFALP